MSKEMGELLARIEQEERDGTVTQFHHLSPDLQKAIKSKVRYGMIDLGLAGLKIYIKSVS